MLQLPKKPGKRKRAFQRLVGQLLAKADKDFQGSTRKSILKALEGKHLRTQTKWGVAELPELLSTIRKEPWATSAALQWYRHHRNREARRREEDDRLGVLSEYLALGTEIPLEGIEDAIRALKEARKSGLADTEVMTAHEAYRLFQKLGKKKKRYVIELANTKIRVKSEVFFIPLLVTLMKDSEVERIRESIKEDAPELTSLACNFVLGEEQPADLLPMVVGWLYSSNDVLDLEGKVNDIGIAAEVLYELPDIQELLQVTPVSRFLLHGSSGKIHDFPEPEHADLTSPALGRDALEARCLFLPVVVLSEREEEEFEESLLEGLEAGLKKTKSDSQRLARIIQETYDLTNEPGVFPPIPEDEAEDLLQDVQEALMVQAAKQGVDVFNYPYS